MLKSIKDMLQALEDNEIKYCHWKSNEHLLEALTGDTDLDVLFLPEQRSKIDKVLNECGLKRFRAMPLMQYNAIEDFIGFDKEEAKIWHLHVHYRMTLGEKHLKGYTITPWTRYIIDNREWDELGIYRASSEIELVLLIVRLALKRRLRDTNRKISKDDLIEYNWLVNRVDKEKLYIVAEKMTNNIIAILIIELCSGNLKRRGQLAKLQRRLRKNFKYYTGYNQMGSRLMRTWREFFWLIGGVQRRIGISSTKANRRVSPSGGCVVAILGCDGAGKSTTLKYVKNEFRKKIDVLTIYFGSGDGSSSLLRKPMKVIAKKIGGKGIGHSIDKEYAEKDTKRVSLKARLYSFAKIVWAVTLACEKKKKLKKMTKARNAGLLVLTDRYPQTEYAGFSDGPLLQRYATGTGIFKKISDWEYRIYRSAYINPPDLTIKLMVPAEIAISRKPEMTIEEIENKKRAVMAMKISEYSTVVDTSKNMTETLGEVMDAIWKII